MIAHVVTVDNRWEMALGDLIYRSLCSEVTNKRLVNLLCPPRQPVLSPTEAPFPALQTLNFLTEFHTDLVVSWLFVSGMVPAGLICPLL